MKKEIYSSSHLYNINCRLKRFLCFFMETLYNQDPKFCDQMNFLHQYLILYIRCSYEKRFNDDIDQYIKNFETDISLLIIGKNDDKQRIFTNFEKHNEQFHRKEEILRLMFSIIDIGIYSRWDDPNDKKHVEFFNK